MKKEGRRRTAEEEEQEGTEEEEQEGMDIRKAYCLEISIIRASEIGTLSVARQRVGSRSVSIKRRLHIKRGQSCRDETARSGSQERGGVWGGCALGRGGEVSREHHLFVLDRVSFS